MNDLKFAFRQLLMSPGFTAVAALMLAPPHRSEHRGVQCCEAGAVPGSSPGRAANVGSDSANSRGSHDMQVNTLD
jgi:hypothetical protein